MSEVQGNPLADEPEPADIEATAREHGWVPESEWRDLDHPPPGGFLTSEEFERRGREIRPILAARNRLQTEEMERLRAEIANVRQTAQKFEHFSQRALERERAEKEQLFSQLEVRRAQAINEGDGNTVLQTERQMRSLQQEPPPPPPPEPQMDPVVAERWVSANPWYGQDQVMMAWAEGRSKELLRGGMPPGTGVLDRLAAEARQAFPDRFPSAARLPASVEGYGRRQPTNYQRTFDDLPAEARQSFEDFKKLGVQMSKQQFLDQYEW